MGTQAVLDRSLEEQVAYLHYLHEQEEIRRRASIARKRKLFSAVLEPEKVIERELNKRIDFGAVPSVHFANTDDWGFYKFSRPSEFSLNLTDEE